MLSKMLIAFSCVFFFLLIFRVYSYFYLSQDFYIPNVQYILSFAKDKAEEAVQKKDVSICTALPIHQSINAPYDDGGKWAHPIKAYDVYPHDDCLIYYLNITNDRAVCDLLSGQSAFAEPKERCFRQIADAHQDPSQCPKLSGTVLIQTCLAVAKRDVRECEVLSADDFYIDSRFDQMVSPKTQCILAVVNRTKDYSVCSSVTDKLSGYMFDRSWGNESVRDDCYRIAGCDKPEKRNEICSLMYPSGTPEEKSKCLTEKWECPTRPYGFFFTEMRFNL